MKVFYNLHPDRQAIYCSKTLGPIFGYSNDIRVNHDNFLTSNQVYTDTSSSNATFGGDDFQLSDRTDSFYFKLKELEVYEIFFE